MPKKAKETGVEQCELVLRLTNSGKLIREVADLIEWGKCTVFGIFKKQKQTGSVQNHPWIGRRSKMTLRIRIRIICYANESHFYNDKTIRGTIKGVKNEAIFKLKQLRQMKTYKSSR